MSATKRQLNGKNGSRLSKPHLRRPRNNVVSLTRSLGVENHDGILYPSPLLRERLQAVFDFWRRSHKLLHRKAYRQDFVIHMTDWLNDLSRLNDLYAHPESYTKDEACDVVFGFFIHAMSHLKAAERILLDKQEQCDPFAPYYQQKDQRVI